MGSKIRRFSFLFCLLSLFASRSPAEIYKWTDESGRVRYSDKPPSEGASPAVLPGITRAPMKVKALPKTCANHGGISCDAGADRDGSVICRDGYKDADNRFNFSCHEAKLEVIEFKDMDGTYSVAVRNLMSVEALNTRVECLSGPGKRKKLEGPLSIAPYQVEKYTLHAERSMEKITAADITVTCANCP